MLGPDATVAGVPPALRPAFRLPFRADSGGSRTACSSSAGRVSSTESEGQSRSSRQTCRIHGEQTKAVEVFQDLRVSLH